MADETETRGALPLDEALAEMGRSVEHARKLYFESCRENRHLRAANERLRGRLRAEMNPCRDCGQPTSYLHHQGRALLPLCIECANGETAPMCDRCGHHESWHGVPGAAAGWTYCRHYGVGAGVSCDCPEYVEASDGCYDCGRPYGDEHGFPDLVIPNEAWTRISPTGDGGGLLCPSCICKRLHDEGMRVEGRFMSGPLR